MQRSSGSAEQPALADSATDRADVQHDPTAGEDLVLAHLKERQRKRAAERQAEREAEEQRPLAKPRAAQRQNKRPAGNACGNVEQPVSKRKDHRLTAESFATCAADSHDPGATSSGSAAQPAQPAQQFFGAAHPA